MPRELAQGDWDASVDHRDQVLPLRTVGTAPKCELDLRRRGPVTNLRLMALPRELLERRTRRKVDECARNCRYRYGAKSRRVALVERSYPSSPDASDAPL